MKQDDIDPQDISVPRCPKDKIYIDRIVPLTNQIFDICYANDIPLFMTFDLGMDQSDPGHVHSRSSACSTRNDGDDSLLIMALMKVVTEGWCVVPPDLAASLKPKIPVQN